MKVDFKKSLSCYKATSGRFDVIEVPPLNYLMVDGEGAPGDTAHADAIEALYPMAYTLKFKSKVDLGRDYVVPPLEGLWWADDMRSFTTDRNPSKWHWSMMIMLPDWLKDADVEAAKGVVADKKSVPTALGRVDLRRLEEGTAFQTLHIGSFDDEGPVLEELHNEVIPSRGFVMTQHHHEIYLSDFRRVTPEKLRTILRQPVAPAA